MAHHHEHLPGPSGPGTVVLDIGGDIGAAVVHTPASLDGAEIEIRPLGERWDGRHVAVRARQLPAGVVHAAVFESLVEGRYEVRVRGSASDAPLASFEVDGGRVTEDRLTV
jgi:hypothetical protein